MQYYTVHHKENSTYMEIYDDDDGLSSAINYQFVLVLL